MSPRQSWIQRVKVYFCLFTLPCSGLHEHPGCSDTAVLRGADEEVPCALHLSPGPLENCAEINLHSPWLPTPLLAQPLGTSGLGEGNKDLEESPDVPKLLRPTPRSLPVSFLLPSSPCLHPPSPLTPRFGRHFGQCAAGWGCPSKRRSSPHRVPAMTVEGTPLSRLHRPQWPAETRGATCAILAPRNK